MFIPRSKFLRSTSSCTRTFRTKTEESSRVRWLFNILAAQQYYHCQRMIIVKIVNFYPTIGTFQLCELPDSIQRILPMGEINDDWVNFLCDHLSKDF